MTTPNFIKLHLGDLAKKTSDLSQARFGCYLLLVTWAYGNGGVLPLDRDELEAIARCHTPDEGIALDMVLKRFWLRRDDGWHNDRIDDELLEFEEHEPEREARKQSQRDRQRVTRDSKRAMFAALRQAGIVPDFNAPMRELRSLIAEHKLHVTQPVTRDVTRDIAVTPRLPEARSQNESAAGARAHAHAREAGEACKAMKAAGLGIDVNPAHPELLAMLRAGITIEELRLAAGDAAVRGKGFVYALRSAQGRRRDAANVSIASASGLDRRQLRDQEVVRALAPALLPQAPGAVSADTLNQDSQRECRLQGGSTT